MKKSSYKVGITVALYKGDSVFANGIRQNGMMLAKLLKLAGHQVYIINFIKNNPMREFPKSMDEYDKVNIFDDPTFPKNLDVLIHLQTAPNENETIQWKKLNPNLKVVGYKCGNNYVNDMEDILFKSRKTHETLFKYDRTIDAMWYVPQQDFNNRDYVSILYDIDAHPIPFVWDPMFIEEHISQFNGNPIYSPKEGPKRISIFEPNVNIVKYSVPPILATEHAYRQRPDLVGFMYASNTDRLIDINLFKSMMNQLNIVRDKKAQFTKRYPIVHFLNANTDIVVSHQWGNPMNYLYLDVLYMGYPLVHNAHIISDLGYYYKDFDIKDAGDLIIKAAAEYDQNYEAHRKENLEKIKRYMPENKALQQEYTKLLDSLFDKDTYDSISWELDHKKNLYK